MTLWCTRRSIAAAVVAELLEVVLRALLVLSAYTSDVVASVRECPHRRFDVLLLMWSSHKFARYSLDAFAHGFGDIPHRIACSRRRIPLTTKVGGLPALATRTLSVS